MNRLEKCYYNLTDDKLNCIQKTKMKLLAVSTVVGENQETELLFFNEYSAKYADSNFVPCSTTY